MLCQNPLFRFRLRTLAVAMLVTAFLAPADLAGQSCGKTGDGCSFFSQCCDGFSCQPFLQKCYHSPRLEGEPCMAGYGCADGLTCEAGTHVCRAPGRQGDPCHATRPCGDGLTCEAGTHVCRGPGREGDPCHATRPCGGGLTCEAGTHVCRAPSGVGEACHATRPCADGLSCQPGVHKCYHVPRWPNEPCVAGHECQPGFTCAPFVQKCMPGELDLSSSALCSSLRVPELSDAARKAGIAMSYSGGGAAAVGVFESIESGGVYGEQGQFGCFVTVCGGVQTDISISTYGTFGMYNSWNDFAGLSFVTTQGASLPLVEFGGFTTAQVLSTEGKLIGSANSLSIGAGLLPVQAGGLSCCTIVAEPNQQVNALASGIETCRQQIAGLIGSSPSAPSDPVPVPAAAPAVAPAAPSGLSATLAEAPPQEVNQTWNRRPVFPSEVFEGNWADGRNITALAWDGEQWTVAMTGNLPWTHQVWRAGPEFPQQYIQEQWNQDSRITSLAHGQGLWAIVMSQGTGWTSQSYLTDAAFPAAAIAEQGAAGNHITEMAYGPGGWVVVVSGNTGWGEQVWLSRPFFPAQEIQEHWNRGLRITGLIHAEGLWYIVMTGNTGWVHQSYTEGTEFPAAEIEQEWSKRFRITSAVKANGQWLVVTSQR
jgi:hypothetical protein